jgi:Fic family protein
MKKVGFTWLLHNLNIDGYRLTHESYLGTTDKTEVSASKAIVRTFNSKYKVKEDKPMHHLEFALKYDHLNLALVKEVFDKVDQKTIEEYIVSKSNGKYRRIIGYLFEFTTGKILEVKVKTTNYEDLIDPANYITGEAIKNSKWKINDNLLGSEKYCPIVRRTSELEELLTWDIQAAIEKLKDEYSPEIFRRASYYLYKKESKSSNEIEKEEPSQDRLDKFITLLEEAGGKSYIESLSETELVRIQNAIVDPRYADKGFRDFQNYIGQTMRDYTQKIHYVCPPPQFVKSLIEGIVNLNDKNSSTATLVKAAIVSFGFVYTHPFEDGNGRIHRFLIHDILVRDGVVPNSTILPVSAQILARMEEYDRTLELVSKLVERKTKYSLNDSGTMTVHNPEEIEVMYRYPDLTNHTIFLARSIQTTVHQDIPKELLFLQRYDELKNKLRDIVDMPNNKIDRMIIFLHQNNGKLAKRKRQFFEELEDKEVEKMEEEYRKIFEN